MNKPRDLSSCPYAADLKDRFHFQLYFQLQVAKDPKKKYVQKNLHHRGVELVTGEDEITVGHCNTALDLRQSERGK